MPPINFLIKPASSGCNLKCNYCFYRSIAESRQVTSYGIMSEDTLEAIVAKGLQYADQMCSFTFQGGEPTLAGLAFFKKLITLEQKYNIKKVKISNSLQTNGLLIDEDWARFLHDNDFLVGLSLDGPSEIHNLHRVDCNKNGSFSRVMKAARLFDRFNVEYNILSVVTNNSCRFSGKIYDFFKKSGFKYLQFIPCLDPLGTENGQLAYSLKPNDFERFLKCLFDKWYDDFIKGDYISIRYFDNLVHMINGQRPEACSMTGVCKCNCVIEADGGLYPCDFYVFDEWKLGNITENSIKEMIESNTAKSFIKSSEIISEDCKNCEWFQLCRGGCRRECEPLLDNQSRSNYFCSAYKSFFEYAYSRLSHVANIVMSNGRLS